MISRVFQCDFVLRTALVHCFFICAQVVLFQPLGSAARAEPQAVQAAAQPAIVLPMERTAYFVGEQVPLAVAGVPDDQDVHIAAVNADGRTLLYRGRPAPLLLDTTGLAAGDYVVELSGRRVVERLTLRAVLCRSAASLQDETTPRLPDFDSRKQYSAQQRAAISNRHWDDVAKVFKETGLTACVAWAASDMGRAEYLDVMARAGALLLVNCDTRPTSFNPVGNDPDELDGMSQRMILTAQANARYANFGGFCFGWDTTGYALGGRRQLLVYWGWGDKADALRRYLDRVDRKKMREFTRRTGLQPVSEAEYISYLLSIKRPEFAPAIDLPTRVWLEEISRYARPLEEGKRAEFEKRLDAWSAYLMGLYEEAYGTFSRNLRGVAPSLRHTASVQIDHAPTRFGQYFPSAYAPLDFRYQSTWNDQVGGPDYAYQWLLTAGILDMERGGQPTWISNALAAAHDRARVPGKFMRVAAHNLAWGGAGIGFALEGFSNLLGGMNRTTNWTQLKGTAGEMDLRAGRDFLDRFVCLALEGRGDHGVGILFSRTQYGRQNRTMGGDAPPIHAFVVLTRLGYTPRLLTEEDLAAGRAAEVEALVVIGQQFPLPANVTTALAEFVRRGGRILVDGSTTVELPGAEKLGLTYPLSRPGKPHNWGVPNLVAGDNDALMFAREYAVYAPAFAAALGDTGRGLFAAQQATASDVTLIQIDGGADATYIIAVNDSHVRTQADWHQVKETLVPLKASDAVLYDCTEEKPLGKVAPLTCDLSTTTARVFAVLPRACRTIGLAATQTVRQGEELILRVEFLDAAHQRLAAVLPFHLALVRPDGRAHGEFYRSTLRDGTFSMAIPIPANVPAGTWSVAVRSQLTGDVATLPVRVEAAQAVRRARVLDDAVVVRDPRAVEEMLARGAKIVLPVFDDAVLPVAEKAKAVLAARGVEVEIRRQAVLATYTLSYDPTDAQQRENARIDRGELIGRIRRETVNANDWYSTLSGYRFGLPVVLLDLAGAADNPLAEQLAQVGILWPQVTDVFPGQGRAIVQCVHWAFAPRRPALVIQAADLDGLMAGVSALGQGALPEDRFTPALQAARAALWRQYHVGGKPAQPDGGRLTSQGLQMSRRPQPLKLEFVGQRPLPADQVEPPAAVVHPATPVPATFAPRQYVLQVRDGERFVETATVEFLTADLRFSQAIALVADVKQAGKMKITAEGLFRFCDRTPMWQAQWEEIIELNEKLVPKQRRPMEFEVRLAGKTVGKLVPVKTEAKEVQLELRSPSGGKPKTAVEEVVTRLVGEVDLPAGRQEILLVHHNIVDGRLEKVIVGQ